MCKRSMTALSPDYNVKASRQLTRARPPMNRESTEQAGNGESRGIITANIATAKSKTSKMTFMANEAMSRILQTDMMVAVSKVLSLQRRYRNKELPIVLFGDSIAVSIQFNTTFQIKNTLLRNAIVNTKSRARQIIEYFPNSTVYFSYVPLETKLGKLNTTEVGKKNDMVTDAGEEKPAAVAPEKESYPGISYPRR